MSGSRRQYPFHIIEPKWQQTWDQQQAFRAFNPNEEIPANHPFAGRHKVSGKVSATDAARELRGHNWDGITGRDGLTRAASEADAVGIAEGHRARSVGGVTDDDTADTRLNATRIGT